MSTICSSSSRFTSARPNFERLQMIMATGGAGVGFLIIHTLHVIMILMDPTDIPRFTAISYSIMYIASLLIGGFLSDHFNSWKLFLVTVFTSSVLTTILSQLTSDNIGVMRVTVVMIMLVSFDVTSWLAAAKYIKECTTPPSQQRLWWTLFTACSSINFSVMIFELRPIFWYVIGLSTLLIMILIAVGYMYVYNNPLTGNGDQEVCQVTLKQLPHMSLLVKFCNYCFFVVLNVLLLVAKWLNPLMALLSASSKEEGDGMLQINCILYHGHHKHCTRCF